MKEMRLSEILSKFACELFNCPANTESKFAGVAPLTFAKAEHISFLTNSKYLKNVEETAAGAIICGHEMAASVKERFAGIIIAAKEPYALFAKLSQFFYEPVREFSGRSEQVFLDKTAVIHETVTVYPFVFVGPGAVIKENTILYPGVFVGGASVIGENCVLYPNVVVREGCTIGKNCILNPGAVIGGDGFGFAPSGMENIKIPQTGGVAIADEVEVGSNSSIDRGAFENTTVGEQTKIDSLVQVGHNVTIGKACFLAAQVGIAGSCILDDRVTLAGQVGVAGHLHLGRGTTVLAKSGVTKDLPTDTYSGIPARPAKEHWKKMAKLDRLLAAEGDKKK